MSTSAPVTSAPEKGYKKLIVWQKADTLAYRIYIATKVFNCCLGALVPGA
jgi:hypothetical protein